jgi:HAD superfamily hydrolase (TIGR01509 family)
VILKAVLFDFNGVIINDEPIHRQLIDELLITENLRPQGREFWQVSLGKTDRSCLQELLKLRGRFVSDEYLDKLLSRKAIAYFQRIESLATLPIYAEVIDFVKQLRDRGYKLGLVTGAIRAEVDFILQKAELDRYFQAIVTGDEVTHSKPAPEGYLLAVQRLNQSDPSLNLQPGECLVIEDSFPGIQAAKSAGMQVCAIANTYPFHLLQRQANWTIDTFADLDLDRVRALFERSDRS